MKAPVRVGVVGCGWWASEHHLPAVMANRDAILVAAADPDNHRREQVRDRYQVEVFDDYEAMLQKTTIDAVVISSPNRTHGDFARMAISAGKSVLIEKPMTLDGNEARALITMAEDKNVHIVVGYPFQMTRTARQLRAMIRSGNLGKLELVVGTYTSSASYLFLTPGAHEGPDQSSYTAASAGGGQGQTQVTHLLSSLLWTSGLRAERVMASMRFGGGALLDTVDAVILDFDTGALGTMSSLGTVPRGASRVQQAQYFGTKGRASHDLLTARVEVSSSDGPVDVYELEPGELAYPASHPVDSLVGLVTGLSNENNGPPDVAAHAVEITEASYLSAVEARPVHLPAS